MLSLVHIPRPLLWFATVSLIANIALWLAAWLLFLQQGDIPAVLHYSIDVGIDFIGERGQITVLPLIGLLVIIGNSVLGGLLWSTDAKVAWIVWSIMPFIQVILGGAFLLIWQTNR